MRRRTTPHDAGGDSLSGGLVKAADFPGDSDVAPLGHREPKRQEVLQAQVLQAGGQLDVHTHISGAGQGPPKAQRLQAVHVAQALGEAPAQTAQALSAASLHAGGERWSVDPFMAMQSSEGRPAG